VRGKPVEYSDLAKHLGVPFEVMTVALRNNASAEEMVQQASIAETLVRSDPAHWLAPERREAFFKAYRMWHMQIQPRFAAAATPAFLYLYSALPTMVKARDSLIEPPTRASRSAVSTRFGDGFATSWFGLRPRAQSSRSTSSTTCSPRSTSYGNVSNRRKCASAPRRRPGRNRPPESGLPLRFRLSAKFSCRGSSSGRHHPFVFTTVSSRSWQSQQ